MAKFTFRKYESSSGSLALFSEGGHIKLKRKICGFYHRNRMGNEDIWRVWLQVETQEGDWRNVKLKAEFGSEDALRGWLQLHTDALVGRYPLHFSEDD